MDIANSLFTSIFGMSVVFTVLVSLILLIYLQSYLMKYFHRKNPVASTAQAVEPVTAAVPAAISTQPVIRPELKLYNIDEKTAAIVMAIVCDEIGIPANELVFKSIRLLEDKPPYS
jgi:Na+-transporting methylmalonyl-CoA/oxaloacetate decarboxylase gamma subunit